MTSFWIMLAGMVITLLVCDYLAKNYAGEVSQLWPGWKQQGVAFITMLFGGLLALEPEMLRPILGAFIPDSPYTGLIIFGLGVLIRSLRQVASVPGDYVPEDVAAEAAITTLARVDPKAIEKGAARASKKGKWLGEKRQALKLGEVVTEAKTGHKAKAK